MPASVPERYQNLVAAWLDFVANEIVHAKHLPEPPAEPTEEQLRKARRNARTRAFWHEAVTGFLMLVEQEKLDLSSLPETFLLSPWLPYVSTLRQKNGNPIPPVVTRIYANAIRHFNQWCREQKGLGIPPLILPKVESRLVRQRDKHKLLRPDPLKHVASALKEPAMSEQNTAPATPAPVPAAPATPPPAVEAPSDPLAHYPVVHERLTYSSPAELPPPAIPQVPPPEKTPYSNAPTRHARREAVRSTSQLAALFPKGGERLRVRLEVDMDPRRAPLGEVWIDEFPESRVLLYSAIEPFLSGPDVVSKIPPDFMPKARQVMNFICSTWDPALGEGRKVRVSVPIDPPPVEVKEAPPPEPPPPPPPDPRLAELERKLAEKEKELAGLRTPVVQAAPPPPPTPPPPPPDPVASRMTAIEQQVERLASLMSDLADRLAPPPAAPAAPPPASAPQLGEGLAGKLVDALTDQVKQARPATPAAAPDPAASLTQTVDLIERIAKTTRPSEVQVDTSEIDERLAAIEAKVARPSVDPDDAFFKRLERMKALFGQGGLFGPSGPPSRSVGAEIAGELAGAVKYIVENPDKIAGAWERISAATLQARLGQYALLNQAAPGHLPPALPSPEQARQNLDASATAAQAKAAAEAKDKAAQERRRKLPPELDQKITELLAARGHAAIVVAAWEWMATFATFKETAPIVQKIEEYLRGQKHVELVTFLRTVFTSLGHEQEAPVNRVQEIADAMARRVAEIHHGKEAKEEAAAGGSEEPAATGEEAEGEEVEGEEEEEEEDQEEAGAGGAVVVKLGGRKIRIKNGTPPEFEDDAPRQQKKAAKKPVGKSPFDEEEAPPAAKPPAEEAEEAGEVQEVTDEEEEIVEGEEVDGEEAEGEEDEEDEEGEEGEEDGEGEDGEDGEEGGEEPEQEVKSAPRARVKKG